MLCQSWTEATCHMTRCVYAYYKAVTRGYSVAH
eukprot:UN07618